MKEEYLLFLEMIDPSTHLSNKHLVTGGTLLELDEFTTFYENAQAIADDINFTNQKIFSQNAILIKKKDFQKLAENNWQPLPIKTEQVLFNEDKPFFIEQQKEQQNMDNKNRVYINQYKEYLLNHRAQIPNSLIRHIKMGIIIDSSITELEMNQLFYVYYKKKNYKKMRNTYLELKRFGVIPYLNSGLSHPHSRIRSKKDEIH